LATQGSRARVAKAAHPTAEALAKVACREREQAAQVVAAVLALTLALLG
jgi:hypothetical protein